MTEYEAFNIFEREEVKNEDVSRLIIEAKNQTQKEALYILIESPELLQPIPFILFCSNANLSNKIISYEEYAIIMKQRAIKNRNIGLLNLSKAALTIAEGRDLMT